MKMYGSCAPKHMRSRERKGVYIKIILNYDTVNIINTFIYNLYIENIYLYISHFFLFVSYTK